jgi:tRNA(adenine34) deaminase
MIMENEHWMREALKEARKAFQSGEVPVGAVVVFENRVIGRGHNQVELLQDPTAHAEMIALTAATNALQSKWLLEASLFVTVEPCPMCAGAIILARLKQLIYGIQEGKTGAHSSIYNLLNDPRMNHQVEVVPGILSAECAAQMSDFFEKVRKNN